MTSRTAEASEKSAAYRHRRLSASLIQASRLFLAAGTALMLFALPALAREVVRSGQVRAYECQEGRAVVETIHGLSRDGFLEQGVFINTYEFSEFDVDGFAGYVWTDIQQQDVSQPFQRLRLVYEGPAEAVTVYFCFLRNGSPFNVSVPLSSFERHPDDNGVTATAILDKSKIKGFTPRDIFELTRLRVELHKAGSRPQSVLFGNVQAQLGLHTVEPFAVLNNTVTGDAGCQIRQTCQ